MLIKYKFQTKWVGSNQSTKKNPKSLQLAKPQGYQTQVPAVIVFRLSSVSSEEEKKAGIKF